MGLLAAERIKLVSTRAPWWCSVTVLALGIGVAALVAGLPQMSGPEGSTTVVDVDMVLGGVAGPGLMVVMILAALAITTEYRFSTIRAGFLAAPRRTGMLTAKAAVVTALSVVVVAVTTVLSYLVGRALAGTGPYIDLALDTPDAWRTAYGSVVVTPLVVVLALAIGVLLRQSAGVIALVVLWPNVIETIFASIGQTGREIYVLLPFANMNRFLGYELAEDDFHWGPWGGLIYFAVFTAVVAVAALYVLRRRDA